MRVLIGYESMYGNTHRVADAIAAGFDEGDEVTVAPVSSFDDTATNVDLLVIGVPTHAHGLPRPGTRRAALDSARTKYERHDVDSAANGPGVREWLQTLPPRVGVAAAAYDTRFRPPGWLVGHPARAIARALARRGATVVMRPESFFIDKKEQLRPGELERAQAWGARLRRAAEARRDHRSDAPAR
jgi:hypothetical protein